MARRVTVLSGAVALLLNASLGFAQDPFADIMNGTDPLGQQLNAFNRGIVQNNMADPQVQQAYQTYMAAGSPYGFMTPEQFAYQWASTGGFTPEGMRYRQEQDAFNRGNEIDAVRRLRDAEAARGKAQGAWAENYLENSSGLADTSRGLEERTDIYGQRTMLPYLEHAQPWAGAGTEGNFQQDAQGRWWQRGWDGNWYPMQ